MTTAAESAKIIRTALKSIGISNRRVSVRAENYSMGSSIHVEIKDATVAMSTVKPIVETQERIDRCSITGDILSGGNRYIHVAYSTEASEQRAAPYVDAVREAMNAVGEEKTTALVSITGTPVLVGSDGFGFQLFNNGRPGMHVNTAECAARYVADYVAEAAEVEVENADVYEQIETEYDARDAELEERNVREAAEVVADRILDELLAAAPVARDLVAYPALRLLA